MFDFSDIYNLIDFIVLCAGCGTALVAGIILIIYRKKHGIKHSIDRSVTEEELNDADEYRAEWLKQNESPAPAEEE